MLRFLIFLCLIYSISSKEENTIIKFNGNGFFKKPVLDSLAPENSSFTNKTDFSPFSELFKSLLLARLKEVDSSDLASTTTTTVIPALKSKKEKTNLTDIISSIDSAMTAQLFAVIQGTTIEAFEELANEKTTGSNCTVNVSKEANVLLAGTQRLISTYLAAKSKFGYYFKQLTIESFLNTTAPKINKIHEIEEILCSNNDEDEEVRNLFHNYLMHFNASTSLQALECCIKRQKLQKESPIGNQTTTTIPTNHSATVLFDLNLKELSSNESESSVSDTVATINPSFPDTEKHVTSTTAADIVEDTVATTNSRTPTTEKAIIASTPIINETLAATTAESGTEKIS